MATLGARRFLLSTLAAGTLVRIAVWSSQGGIHYPDEIFQYLEPANARLTGLGWLPWEFERGARSWLLPAAYGGFLWWGHALELDGWTMQRLLGLLNALAGLSLIPATARIAAALGGNRAGGLAAALTASSVPIAFLTSHTLSEVPGAILTTWGLVWCLESRGTDRARGGPLCAGVAFGLAMVIRPALAPWTLVPALVWAARGELRSFGGYALGVLLCAAAGAALDFFTWGSFGHSTRVQLAYHLAEGGARRHGVTPVLFYLESWFWARNGLGGALLLGAALLGLRRSGIALGAAALPVLVLSFVPNRQERFALSSLPLLLAAGSVGIAALSELWSPRHARAFGAAVVAIVATTGFVGARQLDWHWREGMFAGQRFVGQQADASGVLLEGRIHLNGGYLLLDRHIPQLSFSRRLASHRLFNYLVLVEGSPDHAWAAGKGFETVSRHREFVVLRRGPAAARAASGAAS